MASHRFARLIDIVGEAVERPTGERDDYLISATEGDQALLEDARALVAEAEITSVADVTRRLEGLVGRAAGDAMEPEASPPSRIGPYEVVRSLGSGGMGLVYLARQTGPINRDVAIKVVRRAVADGDALARFSVERQALALMEHPGIARIYDAGATEDGLPYFVMELVEGTPITRYCEEHALPLDARLELFRAVCEAVHHAHQRGVIHRDLKPSNILIVTSDGRPVPKVIDFGIAKATDALLLDEGVHTRVGSLIGTLDYMSPEQLRGGPEGIDVRADVYALGVILYQLVTGRHPFADTTLRQAGLLEARRIILESDPPRPSSSHHGSAGRGTIARGGRRPVRRDSSLGPPPGRRVGKDLDWIVLKALEKDRERRYGSALDLARELERYARHLPVSAGPPSITYRARKFVRRHRVGVTAAALVTLALLSGTALASMGFVRARAEARQSQAISGFLTDMLASVRPDEQGRAVTVREVLDEARGRLEAGGFADDPETEAALALVIGHSYEGLGDYDAARDLIRRSVDLRRDLYDANDRRLYTSLHRLGTVLWKRGALDEALALRLDLAEMTERVFDPSDHAESLSNLGNTYADLGDFEHAAEYLLEAVEIGRRLPGREGELDLARFLNNLGTVYYDLEDFEAAAAVTREALDIRERLLGVENDVYTITLGNLGDLLLRLDDIEAADTIFAHALDLYARIYGEDHPRTVHAYVGVSEVRFLQGRLEEAEDYMRRALEIQVASATDTHRGVASERRNLAEILIAMDRLAEAGDELEAAWNGLEAAGEEGSLQGRHVASEMARLQQMVDNPEQAAIWRARAGGGG